MHALLLVLGVVSGVLLAVDYVHAGDLDDANKITVLATIQVTPNLAKNPTNKLTSFDISWVDQRTQRYYLADRSNAGVDIFDARKNTFIDRVTGFIGFTGVNASSGPDGVVVASRLRLLFAGDGDSTLKIIDLKRNPPAIIDTVSTHGKRRVDEMAYDPRDHIVAVANNADTPPFMTFVSTVPDASGHHLIRGRIDFPGASGIEQSVWNPANGMIYLSVPDGFIAKIDPHCPPSPTAMCSPTATLIPTPDCAATGLTRGPNQHLLAGCDNQATIVFDIRTEKVIKVITQVGGSDEVWFNQGDGNYYVAARNDVSGPVLGVIDAHTNTWLRNIPTAPNAHSVAADAANNHVFVPLTPNTLAAFNNAAKGLSCTNGCIAVFGVPGEEENEGRDEQDE